MNQIWPIGTEIWFRTDKKCGRTEWTDGQTDGRRQNYIPPTSSGEMCEQTTKVMTSMKGVNICMCCYLVCIKLCKFWPVPSSTSPWVHTAHICDYYRSPMNWHKQFRPTVFNRVEYKRKKIASFLIDPI